MRDLLSGAVVAASVWAVCVYLERGFPSRLRGLRARLEYPLLRTRLGEGWAILAQRDAQASYQPSFRSLVDGLLEIYARYPEGYIPDVSGPDAQEVREIGEVLNEQGGMGLMRAAHLEFAARNYFAKRNLEHLWDGIGEWLG